MLREKSESWCFGLQSACILLRIRCKLEVAHVATGLSLHLDHDAEGSILDTENAAQISTVEDDKAQSVSRAAVSFGFLKEGKSATRNWNGDVDEDEEEEVEDEHDMGRKDDFEDGRGKYTCLQCEQPDCRPQPSCEGASQVCSSF